MAFQLPVEPGTFILAMFLKSENHYESLAQTDVMAISKPGGSSHTRRHIAKVVGLMALVACLPISFVMGLQQGRTNRHSIVLEWCKLTFSVYNQH